jgi:homospermidine synthase
MLCMRVRGVESAIVELDPFIRVAGDLKRRAKIWRFDRLSDGWGNLGNLVSAHSSTVDWEVVSNVRSWRRIQPVDATDSLNISAGVWKPSVLRGLSFNCRAIALS